MDVHEELLNKPYAMPSSTTRFIIIGVTGLALALSGLTPAFALAAPTAHVPGKHALPNAGQMTKSGRVLGGTITAISGLDLTLQPAARRNATTTPPPVTIHTVGDTVISKNGQKIALTDLTVEQMVIVSGVRTPDGSVEASRIFVRTNSGTNSGPFWHRN